MRSTFILCCAFVSVSFACLAGLAPEDAAAFWREPAFRDAFMGSYGMRAEIEPRVTVVERELMEKVMALMGGDDGNVQAVALIEKNLEPASSAVFDFTLGNIHFQEDRLTNAAACYVQAIGKFPSFQRAHKNLGLVRIRSNDFAAAIEPLTRAIELGVNDGMTYGLLGHVYAMTEQYASSESAYRLAMMLQPASLDWKLGLGRALFRQQKYADAVALCDELLRREPDKADYWLLEANAFLGMKQPLKAAEIYEMLDASGQLPVAALYTLGDIYVNDGLTDQAAETYGRILAREQTIDAARHIRNAEVLVARGAASAARGLLKQIGEKAGATLSDVQRRGMLKLEARLAAAGNEVGETQIRLLEEIVALDPLDGEALILLAQNHAAAGGTEKAAFYFERAAGIEAFEADAKLRHGQMLVRTSAYQEALPLLKRAQDLKPREDVARYIEQVERVARARAR